MLQLITLSSAANQQAVTEAFVGHIVDSVFLAVIGATQQKHTRKVFNMCNALTIRNVTNVGAALDRVLFKQEFMVGAFFPFNEVYVSKEFLNIVAKRKNVSF